VCLLKISLLNFFKTLSRNEKIETKVQNQPLNRRRPSLNHLIDYQNSISFNTKQSIAGVLRNEELESDSDHQMLLYFCFRQNCVLQAISFDAPDSGSMPVTIKLYVNKKLNFSNVYSNNATTIITLIPELILEVISLDMAKYNRVKSISIFIENNKGGWPTTILRGLQFDGHITK